MTEEKYLLEKIKDFPKVYKKYTYDSEVSVNPFYSDLEHCPRLCVGETRIWALRTDLILAVGIKNANDIVRGSSIFDKADSSVHHYINKHDRYGHPSLITPNDNYDGSVYIAGWVYQHADHLEVIMWSGRYSNEFLTPAEAQNLEQYIALKLMMAWGEQKILFLTAISEHFLHLFFQGSLSVSVIPYRSYDCIKSIQKEIFYYSIINYEFDYTLEMLSTYPYLKDEELDSDSNTAFWLFAELENIHGLDLLKKLGVDVNQVNCNNETALHVAAREGKYNVVRKLIYLGASQISLNLENKTPVDVAKYNIMRIFFDTNIVCMRIDEILDCTKIVTQDVMNLIVSQFYSTDEESSFVLLSKCKESVIRHCPEFIEQYELQLEERLTSGRERGLINVIKSGYTFRAINMLCNQYKDLINIIIDENGNTPLIYFILTQDVFGIGRLLMIKEVNIDISNNYGYTFKDYLALSTKNFLESLDLLMPQKTDIKLFISKLKSLFYFKKSLEEYISWSYKAPIYYYIFSIYNRSDLYLEAKKLIFVINELRLKWSDKKYAALIDDYRNFCVKGGIEYYSENLESDAPQIGIKF